MRQSEDAKAHLYAALISTFVRCLHRVAFEGHEPEIDRRKGIISGRAGNYILRGWQQNVCRFVETRTQSKLARLNSAHISPHFPRFAVQEIDIRCLAGERAEKLHADLLSPNNSLLGSKCNFKLLKQAARFLLTESQRSKRKTEHPRTDAIIDFAKLVTLSGARLVIVTASYSLACSRRKLTNEASSQLVGLGITLTDPNFFPDRDTIPYDYLSQRFGGMPVVRPIRVTVMDRIRAAEEFASGDLRTMLWRYHRHCAQVGRLVHQKLQKIAAGAIEVSKVALDKENARRSAQKNGFEPTGRFDADGYEWHVRARSSQRGADLHISLPHNTQRRLALTRVLAKQVAQVAPFICSSGDPALIVGSARLLARFAPLLAQAKPDRPFIAIVADKEHLTLDSWRLHEPNLRYLSVGPDHPGFVSELSETMERFQTQRGTDVVFLEQSHTSEDSFERMCTDLAQQIEDLGAVIVYSRQAKPKFQSLGSFRLRHLLTHYEAPHSPAISVSVSEKWLGLVNTSHYSVPNNLVAVSAPSDSVAAFASVSDCCATIPCFVKGGALYLGCIDAAPICAPALQAETHRDIEPSILLREVQHGLTDTLRPVGFAPLQGRAGVVAPKLVRLQNDIYAATRDVIGLSPKAKVARILNGGLSQAPNCDAQQLIALQLCHPWENHFMPISACSLHAMEANEIISGAMSGVLHDAVLEFAARSLLPETKRYAMPWIGKTPHLTPILQGVAAASSDYSATPQWETVNARYDQVVNGDTRIHDNECTIVRAATQSPLAGILAQTALLKVSSNGVEIALEERTTPSGKGFLALPGCYIPKNIQDRAQARNYVSSYLYAQGIVTQSTMHNLGGFLLYPHIEPSLFFHSSVYPMLLGTYDSATNTKYKWLSLRALVKSPEWESLDLISKVIAHRAIHALNNSAR